MTSFLDEFQATCLAGFCPAVVSIPNALCLVCKLSIAADSDIELYIIKLFRKNILDVLVDLELLPNILQKKYALLRDLDKSLQDILQQNEQRCQQEIEDIKQGLLSGSITPDPSNTRFSDEALDEQKHSIRIADEKVALAIQAYDLVDTHIQQLDQYLKTSEEENRREKELASTSASASSDANADGSTKTGRGSEGGRGGRKKTRLAASAAATLVPVNPPSMDLDVPVDPNEPTYCLCNQVSYGEMVACDNPDCRIEWFHFGCVGLKEKPKGKWYCSDCAVTHKRRKSK